MNFAGAFYRLLLRCYPRAFREEYGGQMLLAFQEQQANGRAALACVDAARDAFTIAPKEHAHVFFQDLRYALRSMIARPGFSAVAILSLALGIGANTAIYSLWNAVLRAPLPLVPEPERVVILTDPDASGAWSGNATGDRLWLTYTEFRDFRDHTDVFDGLMASEASLGIWQVRYGNGGFEDVRGRLVSGEYFDVLGVRPVIGHTFKPEDDAAAMPMAVISYNYWQGRFAGRADIVGQAMAMRNVTFTIVGVMPRGFIGETGGQQPDAWVPLSLQPKVITGEDRLHDAPPTKMMWLHVFGRLKPNVSLSQASAQVNTRFKSGLESYYGSITAPDQRREYMDQAIRIRSAPNGASEARSAFDTSLTAMFAAVGILLLIACANLANLLLARGTARRAEIAMRLSLGASRARLIRQLVTESTTLAAISGLAGLAVAYALHRALVAVLARSEGSFKMDFTLDWRILGFTLAATLAATLLFGVLPAWSSTRTDASEALKEQSRATAGGQIRPGRLLVSLQLALCLPLLLCAGLLIRTLQNLQGVDLGYDPTGLIQARVSPIAAGYTPEQRDRFLEALLTDLRAIPGVRSVSFTHNGVFTGSRSASAIEVEGYTPTGKNDRDSGWDMVESDYFATMGLRILRGRALRDSDNAAAPSAMVINEAFAKQFFTNRDPLGMRVTIQRGPNRYPHTIVGVVQNSRTHAEQIRNEVTPRFYTASEQNYIAERMRSNLLIRSSRDAGATIAAVRNAVQRRDPAMPVLNATPIADLAELIRADSRSMAQLAFVFGGVALILSAIGLYGVLSYGVAQRTREIAVRMALGARPGGVIGMILRETAWMVVTGLAAGGVVAYFAARWIASQLFRVSPADPLSLGIAIAVLALVSLAAAYLPSRRASKLDPMVALRQE